MRKEVLTKDQLSSPTFYINYAKIGYQIGSPNVFYYKIYSDAQHEFSTIRKTPLNEFHSIEGIEVTAEQYDYIMEKKYLDENAPNLTPDQLTYIKQQNEKKSFWNSIF